MSHEEMFFIVLSEPVLPNLIHMMRGVRRLHAMRRQELRSVRSSDHKRFRACTCIILLFTFLRTHRWIHPSDKSHFTAEMRLSQLPDHSRLSAFAYIYFYMLLMPTIIFWRNFKWIQSFLNITILSNSGILSDSTAGLNQCI